MREIIIVIIIMLIIIIITIIIIIIIITVIVIIKMIIGEVDIRRGIFRTIVYLHCFLFCVWSQ